MSWTKPGQGYLIEEKMGLPTMAIKPIMKDIEKLMKKHDAYVSNKDKDVTTMSPKALNDPCTPGNPKKTTLDDMASMYQHSIEGKLY